MKSTPVSKRTTGISVGAAAPLGASVTADGVNFSVFSKRATGIDLLLFDRVDDAKAARVIGLNPSRTTRGR